MIIENGRLEHITYYSTTVEREKNANILLPAGYSKEEQYPVLYILHGYWGDENSLLNDFDGLLKLPDIIGNLISRKEAEKMIVVFPYIYTSKEKKSCNALDLENSLNYDNFINDLITDLMPYLKENYAIAYGRENTAITGFSMGGRESLFIGLTRTDLFGYIGAVCPAPGLTPGVNKELHPGQLQEEELSIKDEKKAPYLIMLTAGTSDNVVEKAPEEYHDILSKNGVKHVWNMIPDGAHDRTSIEPHIYEFIKKVFKKEKRIMNTCNNPILPGFYPDPSICKVEKNGVHKYYLVASTFSYFPGVPIFESEDMKNWKQIGNVLDRESQLPLNGCEHSQGIFAPTIRYHDGIFYMITTNVSGGGNFFVTASHPQGPWSEPYYLGEEAPGIDPSLFFDEDGTCYYIGTRPNSSGVKYNGDWEVWIQELDLETKKLTGSSHTVWNGSQRDVIWPEAPHLLKKDGYYYILHAEGGTCINHCIAIARSKSVFGPYENNPKNPIFTHRHLGKEYPITAVGHGDLVENKDGNWYMVMLANRKCEGYVNLGRETFLAKVVWEDGWPVVNPGKGVLEDVVELWEEENDIQVIEKETNYFFDKKQLPYEFLWLRNPEHKYYSLLENPGFLRIYFNKIAIGEKKSPSFVAIRQQHWNYSVITRFLSSAKKEWETTGLVIMQNDDYHIRFVILVREGRNYAQVIKCINGEDSLLGECCIPDGEVQLKIKSRGIKANFYYQNSDKWDAVAENVDIHELSTEIAGGFVGCTIGMYASANGHDSQEYVDFSCLCYKEII